MSLEEYGYTLSKDVTILDSNLSDIQNMIMLNRLSCNEINQDILNKHFYNMLDLKEDIDKLADINKLVIY